MRERQSAKAAMCLMRNRLRIRFINEEEGEENNELVKKQHISKRGVDCCVCSFEGYVMHTSGWIPPG